MGARSRTESATCMLVIPEAPRLSQALLEQIDLAHQPAARRIRDLVSSREREYRIPLGAQAGEAQITLDVPALGDALGALTVEPDIAFNAHAIQLHDAAGRLRGELGLALDAGEVVLSLLD